MTASININGVHITGRSIKIKGGRVAVDGADVTPAAKDIRVEVVGHVDAIDVDECASMTIIGGAGKVTTMSGDINCGDVAGSIKTMSGDVVCGKVAGGVSSMSGDIRGH